MPVTLIGEAVFARCLSALKDERVRASAILPGGPQAAFSGDKKQFIEDIRQAVYAAKIISYAQGFMLLREAAKQENWNLNYGGIALMWRGGCIIRSVFLGEITNAFKKNPALDNLLLDPFFTDVIKRCVSSYRKVVSQAVLLGVPVPAFSSALAFYDGYRSKKLPANLLQAQRDYFGAHTYEVLSTLFKESLIHVIARIRPWLMDPYKLDRTRWKRICFHLPSLVILSNCIFDLKVKSYSYSST